MHNLIKHLLMATMMLPLLGACGGSDNPPAATVIGHRGASALRPEHTLAAYQKAIDDGADFIEPDLVITADGVLVARHENEISGTTDVASKPEFAARRTTKNIDGVATTGWFTEDFTLAELKTLRAVERIPQNRPANTAFNGQFPIPTLQEVIDLAQAQSRSTGRTIGIYPETKHPTFFKSIGRPLEAPLLDALARNGYTEPSSPVFVQSFEVANLKEMRARTRVRLVQLYGGPTQRPFDFTAAGDSRTYGDMATAAGLREVATYAQGVGPVKDLVIPRNASNNLGTPTAFVTDAHAARLLVHIYTLRPENPFLPANLRRGNVASLTERGDSVAEIQAFLAAGIDGFFTDDPAIGRQAVNTFRR